MGEYRPILTRDLDNGLRPPKVADYAALFRPLDGGAASTDGEGGSGAAPSGPLGAAGPSFITHVVTRSDSIEGLCLQYKISKATLRQLNDLPSDNIHTVASLRIPFAGAATLPADTVPKPESHASILRRFKVTHGLADGEARYYLDDSDYDEGKAAAVLRGHLAEEARAASGAGVGGLGGPPLGGDGGRGVRAPSTVIHDTVRGAEGSATSASLRHRPHHS